MLSIKSVSGKDYLYQDGKRVTFVRSPHISAGFADGEPRFLVMHYTGGSTAQSSVDWFADPLSKVSAHVTIERDGTLYQSVSFSDRAWHCGASRWAARNGKVVSGLNDHALGIELANAGACRQTAAGTWRNGLGVQVGAGDIIRARHKSGTVQFEKGKWGPSEAVDMPAWEIYPQAQLFAARTVAQALLDHYGLAEVMGHDDISPGRKTDPGPLFDINGFRDSLDGNGGDGAGTWRVRPGTPEGLAIRVGPGKQYDKVREANLLAGTELVQREVQGIWWYVTALDKAGNNIVDGWVHSSYLMAG